MTLPVRSVDIQNNPWRLTEGWKYSVAEQRIHRHVIYGGVDLAIKYGTTLVAPGDGIAMASYHCVPLKDDVGKQVTYKDKPVGWGLGYFVQLYVPEVDRYVQLGHLSDIKSVAI